MLVRTAMERPSGVTSSTAETEGAAPVGGTVRETSEHETGLRPVSCKGAKLQAQSR
jgi:hypothetical protein